MDGEGKTQVLHLESRDGAGKVIADDINVHVLATDQGGCAFFNVGVQPGGDAKDA